MLLRFLDAEAGTYTLGGTDAYGMDGHDVRRLVGLCAQDAHLFDSTVRENLLLARKNATESELRDALAGARLLEWADGLPEGLDTLIGEHGARLSGGQRQRLALARALLADFPVLVLDEPAEHLDLPTADALTADLLAATEGRTTPPITHRLAGLAAVDEVIGAGRGTGAQRGTRSCRWWRGRCGRCWSGRRRGICWPGRRRASGSPDNGPDFPHQRGTNYSRGMSVVPASPRPDGGPDVPRLLEAVRSIGGLELHSTLDRICEKAAELADACYAAIGVVAEDGEGLADFVFHGVDEETARRIGQLPDEHKGLLGAHPRPGAGTARAVGRGHARVRISRAPSGDAQLPGGSDPGAGEDPRNLYLAEKRGGGPFTDDDLSMVRVLAAEAGIAIGNARLYEAARQRERWIDGSVACDPALLSADDAEDALQVVAEQALQALRIGGRDRVVRRGGRSGRWSAVAKDRPSKVLGAVVPPESELVAELLDGGAVFLDDAATDPRMVTDFAREYGPTMMLPLQSDCRLLGALVTPRERGGRPFTETERTLAAHFASQAASALIMAEAQRDRERLAVYEDRDRIARDLHDLVIQRLFATGMMLESAQRNSAVPEVREGVERAVDELDVTIQEIRTAVFALQQGPAEVPSGLRTRGAAGDQHGRRAARLQAHAPFCRARRHGGR